MNDYKDCLEPGPEAEEADLGSGKQDIASERNS